MHFFVYFDGDADTDDTDQRRKLRVSGSAKRF